ncbi:MAG: hypothetical protein K6A44_07580 [bacterium]|nr:hypothetical protein [bacterium]
MHINPINNICFKSRRQDRNYVSRLSVQSAPINENLGRNIDAALEEMAQNPSSDNIRFLLSTAQNLAYGFPANSDFRMQILADSPIKDKPISNTDWELKLKQAVQSAISKNQTPDRPELEKKFDETFSLRITLSPQEHSIIENRRNILHNPILQSSKDKSMTQNVRKNLDYFIFSSEISTADKEYCLKKISYFLSKQYKINPQLKGKKLQILDEILNDIIIKTPEEAAQTIKNVNQRHHGMCAAIAACRKLLAYTDKRNYIDNIFEELNSSPTMSIFDITQLGSGIKVPVEKIHIDFNDALEQNYRIIDASALQWMQNASRTGDGNIKICDFIPFDKDNYELYADSFWIAGFPENGENIHEMLKSVIKARRYAREIHQKQAHLAALKDDYKNSGIAAMKDLNRLNKNLDANLSEIMPDRTAEEIKLIAARILNLSKGCQYVSGANYKHNVSEKPEFIINPDEPKEVQKKKIKNFLLQFSPNDKLGERIDDIYENYEQITSATNTHFEALNRQKSPKNLAGYYKLLFLYATAYQDALEKNLDEQQYATNCLSIYNLPTRREVIKGHFNNIISELKKENKVQDYTLLTKLLKAQPDRKELLAKMYDFSENFEKTVEAKYENIIQHFGFKNKKEMLAALIEAYIENIETNDKEEIASLSKTYKINPTKFAALKFLKKMLSEIKNDTFKGSFDSVLSDFKVKDEISFLTDITKSISTIIENPDVSIQHPEPLYFFIKNILNKGNTDIANTLPDIENKIAQLQNYIISVEDKFNVPTAKDVVLAYHRRKGEVLNADEFEILRKKFDEIAHYNDMLNDTNTRMHNPEIYRFSKQEKEILRRIENNFNKSEKYVNKLYNAINRIFKHELDKIYNETGRLNGDFWTREEGSSGLFDSQEIKILEQMTGRPFHIEKDLKRAIEQLKEGIGGGEINTCVCDDEFSGHAQFLYAVSPISIMSPKSKQLQTVDAIWHDNSWGRYEHKNDWLDESGLTRTNYANGTGGKDGFIVRGNDTTGWDADYAMYGKGINMPKQIDNPRESKYYKFVGEEYSLFDSIMLPGEASVSKEKAFKLAREILEQNPTKKRLKALFSKIDNGEIPNIRNLGERFDKTINTHIVRVIKEAKKIKSEEELMNLPENHPIKITLQKMAILKTPYGKENEDIIDNLMTQRDIDTYNQRLLNKLKLFTAGYLGQNSMLVQSEKIKGALLNFISDFEKDNHCTLPQLKSEILKALRVQNNEFTNNLKTIVQQNITNAVDKFAKSAPQKDQLKSNLLSLFNIYYDDTYSPEKILQDKDFAPILNIIDRKFNPESDAEVKNIVKRLQNTDSKEINALLKDLSLEDFGVKYQPIYHILKVIQSENYEAADDFSTALFSYFAYDLLPKDPEMKVALGNTYDVFKQKYDRSVNTLYRSLFVNLSYAEIDGIINKHREEYLKKYSIRASFPDVKYHSSKNIFEATGKNLETIRTLIRLYKETLDEGNLVDIVEEFKKIDFDKIPMSEEYYQKTLHPIFKLIFNSKSVGDLGKKCVNTLSQINNAEKLSVEKKYSLLRTLSQQLKEIEPVFNKTLFLEKKEQYNKKIKEIIQGATDGFVSTPNQKSQMIRLLKQYVKAVSKNRPQIFIEKLEMEIKEHASKHYALKNPTTLLDEIIKLKLQDRKNRADTNKERIALGIRLLESVLDSAHKTEIECKIMDEINSGRIYDLKKNLRDYKFVSGDGTSTEILSDTGIYVLFDTLYSTESDDPMGTVNLLCQHSGLSEDFCRVLAGKFEVGKFKNFYIAFKERLQKIRCETDICKKLYGDLVATNPTNYSIAAKEYINTLNKTFGSNNKVIKSYINSFISFSENLADLSDLVANKEDLSIERKAKITSRLLEETHHKALNQIVYDFSSHLKKFNDSSIEFEKGIDVLRNLKLSKFSPQYSAKEKLLNALEQLKEIGYNIGEEAENLMDELYTEVSNDIRIEI